MYATNLRVRAFAEFFQLADRARDDLCGSSSFPFQVNWAFAYFLSTRALCDRRRGFIAFVFALPVSRAPCMNYHQDDSRVVFVAFSKQKVQSGNEKTLERVSLPYSYQVE